MPELFDIKTRDVMDSLQDENKYLHEELESCKAELILARNFINNFDFANMSNRRVERELAALKELHHDHMHHCKPERDSMITKIAFLESEVLRLQQELEAERAIKLAANVE